MAAHRGYIRRFSDVNIPEITNELEDRPEVTRRVSIATIYNPQVYPTFKSPPEVGKKQYRWTTQLDTQRPAFIVNNPSTWSQRPFREEHNGTNAEKKSNRASCSTPTHCVLREQPSSPIPNKTELSSIGEGSKTPQNEVS